MVSTVSTSIHTLVVGAGQAGLATSHWLTQRGVEHVVLERSRLAANWRRRWDSFRIATPNRGSNLPGAPYAGPEPDGFMSRDELVALLERYASTFSPPVHEDVRVDSVAPNDEAGKGFVVRTSRGTWRARNVVIATGLLQQGRVPQVSEGFSGRLNQLHADEYRNPGCLPEGGVLVVGTGLSGTQIAHELNVSGRRVFLSVGSNGRTPRRYRGRDVQTWIAQARLSSKTPERFSQHAHISEPGPDDLSLWSLARRGVTLVGHIEGVQDDKVELSQDLAARLADADRVDEEIRRQIDAFIREQGLDVPEEVPPEQPRFEVRERHRLDLGREGITNVLWATGYRYDYAFVRPPVLDATGFPRQERGVTGVPGLYFVGMNWLVRPYSAFVGSVGAEAEVVVDHLSVRT